MFGNFDDQNLFSAIKIDDRFLACCLEKQLIDPVGGLKTNSKKTFPNSKWSLEF